MKLQILLVSITVLLSLAQATDIPYKTYTGQIPPNCYLVDLKSGDNFVATLSWVRTNQNLDLTLYKEGQDTTSVKVFVKNSNSLTANP
jgi:hypothetical protein